MKQLNLNVTDEFEKDLQRFMKKSGIQRKSDAVRQAVHQAASSVSNADYDYRQWLGALLREPLNPHPKFKDEDALWS